MKECFQRSVFYKEEEEVRKEEVVSEREVNAVDASASHSLS